MATFTDHIAKDPSLKQIYDNKYSEVYKQYALNNDNEDAKQIAKVYAQVYTENLSRGHDSAHEIAQVHTQVYVKNRLAGATPEIANERARIHTNVYVENRLAGATPEIANERATVHTHVYVENLEKHKDVYHADNMAKVHTHAYSQLRDKKDHDTAYHIAGQYTEEYMNRLSSRGSGSHSFDQIDPNARKIATVRAEVYAENLGKGHAAAEEIAKVYAQVYTENLSRGHDSAHEIAQVHTQVYVKNRSAGKNPNIANEIATVHTNIYTQNVTNPYYSETAAKATTEATEFTDIYKKKRDEGIDHVTAEVQTREYLKQQQLDLKLQQSDQTHKEREGLIKELKSRIINYQNVKSDWPIHSLYILLKFELSNNSNLFQKYSLETLNELTNLLDKNKKLTKIEVDTFIGKINACKHTQEPAKCKKYLKYKQKYIQLKKLLNTK